MTAQPQVQQALDFTEKESLSLSYNAPPNAKTQAGRILALLIAARGEWVSLTQILNLRVAQYSARIRELRQTGFVIENRTEMHDGQRRSWFRLILQPANAAAANVAPRKE